MAVPAIAMAAIFRVSMEAPVGMPPTALAAPRQTASIAASWIEALIDIAMKLTRPMKPRTGADEEAVGEPCGTVVAIRRAVVRGVREIPIGADRLRTNIYREGDLCSLGAGSGYQNSRDGDGEKQTFELVHDCSFLAGMPSAMIA